MTISLRQEIKTLWRQKRYKDILSLFSDSELSKVLPELIIILFESALSIKDKKKCEILFENSLQYLSTEYDSTSQILCNVLAYLFLPDTLNRSEKINIVRNKLLSSESKLLFDHRVKTFYATLSYDIREYCRLQSQSYKLCWNLYHSNNKINDSILFKQIHRTSKLYKYSKINTSAIKANQLSRTNERRYDLLLSCTKEYFILFADTVHNLLSQYNNIHVHLVLISRGLKNTTKNEYSNLTSRFHVYRKIVSPALNQKQLAALSTIARYEYLWPIMQRVKNDILVLDIDLSLQHLNVCSLIDNTQYQQELMPNFVLNYSNLSGDYQSNISAGMLFASISHDFLYHQMTILLENLAEDAYLWGIDQAIIIQSLAKNNLQPAMINYISSVPSDSPLWFVDYELQLIKSKLRF